MPRILKSLGAILAVIAILAYVAYLVVYVAYAVDLFRWPFDYDQGEGFELYDAILYSQGEWPYRDNAVYPFYASNYPPLFHLLIVPLLPIFGPQLIAGRLVSFIATLVTAGVIAAVVRREVSGWFIPLISGLAFLASNYVYQIGPLCRMHMTMVMFETLAIAFIARFEHPQHGQRNLILGLLMLLCAGYTKQMAVFTVIAALSYVFLRDIKKAVVAGVALAVVAGTIFWLLNVATGGQWWVNTIQANVNEFEYRQTIFLFGQWFRLHTVFILLAAGYLIYELFWDRLSIYSLWFFFALGTGALSGKWGAGFGYFTTAVAAACLASGLALGRLSQFAIRNSQFAMVSIRLRLLNPSRNSQSARSWRSSSRCSTWCKRRVCSTCPPPAQSLARWPGRSAWTGRSSSAIAPRSSTTIRWATLNWGITSRPTTMRRARRSYVTSAPPMAPSSARRQCSACCPASRW